MEDLLAKLGLKAVYLVSGFFGAIITLIFNKNLGYLKSVILVVGGTIGATFLTPLLIGLIPFFLEHEPTAGFLCGFLSMGMLGGLFRVSDRFKSDPIQTLKDIKKILI